MHLRSLGIITVLAVAIILISTLPFIQPFEFIFTPDISPPDEEGGEGRRGDNGREAGRDGPQETTEPVIEEPTDLESPDREDGEAGTETVAGTDRSEATEAVGEQAEERVHIDVIPTNRRVRGENNGSITVFVLNYAHNNETLHATIITSNSGDARIWDRAKDITLDPGESKRTFVKLEMHRSGLHSFNVRLDYFFNDNWRETSTINEQVTFNQLPPKTIGLEARLRVVFIISIFTILLGYVLDRQVLRHEENVTTFEIMTASIGLGISTALTPIAKTLETTPALYMIGLLTVFLTIVISIAYIDSKFYHGRS